MLHLPTTGSAVKSPDRPSHAFKAIRWAVGWCLTLLLAAGSGGCSGSAEEGNDRRGGLAAAVRSAETHQSYRGTFAMRSNLDSQEMRFDGRMTSTADGSRARVKGTLVEGNEPPFEMDGIMLGDILCFRSPQLAGQLPPGKKWVCMEDRSSFPSTLTPGEFVTFLHESGTVETVGQERIRGRMTTHYRGPLDLESLARRTGPVAERRLRQIPGAGSFDITVDVWVAVDSHVLLRMAATLRSPQGTNGQIHVVGDILDYGVKVPAEPPQPDLVADPSELGAG